MERPLFLASVLLAGRTHAIDSISDPASFYDHEHLALVQLLSERVTLELARVVPASSSIWGDFDAISTAQLEAGLDQLERDRSASAPDGEDMDQRGRWAAPATLLASAVMAAARPPERPGRRVDDAALTAMLSDLAEAIQIRSDLASMHRDLQRGRTTFPIVEVARAADIALRPWPAPEVVLGAMVVTGSLPAILEPMVIRVRGARRTAVELELPTFAAYLDDVAGVFEDRARSRTGGTKPARALVTIVEPTIPKALSMAEGFLLADPTFKESWESHREGMFGSPDVASRFPAGLILEILCGHGLALADEVDTFLSFTAANGFRYYDHPWSGVDSDTVGVSLRLQRFSSEPGEHITALDDVLDALEVQVRSIGAVPVWIAVDETPGSQRPQILALGEGCGTVAAHLLLGLCEADPLRHAAIIETGASHLLGRIDRVGLGANVNYPPLFALAVFARLIGRFEGQRYGPELACRAAAARRALQTAIGDAVATAPRTPQEAALRILACLDMDVPEWLDPAWTSTVLKGQRFDGSWAAEPFAAAPNRGSSVTWYSSTILTTALCYDAVARSADRRHPIDRPGPR